MTEKTEDLRDALAKALCAVEMRSKAATIEEVVEGVERWTRHRYEAERLMVELVDYGVALAVLSAPQEAAPVCAWCPLPARGDAWHNDGKLHPSCGQIGHGQGWVPPYLAPVAKPCGESDDDIRGRLSELLFTIYDHGTQPNALREADAILAAFPVLSRDIAGEIEAMTIKVMPDEGDELFNAGMRRAAEIVRNGR